MRAFVGAVLCFAFAYIAHAAETARGTLVIRVRTFPNQEGEMAYSVFSSSDGFPSDPAKAVRHGFAPIPENKEVDVELLDLPYGEYAVSVYHDADGNHKLGKNFLGIPTEGVGASNNPRGRMGPPRYDSCKFQLDHPTLETRIKLVN